MAATTMVRVDAPMTAPISLILPIADRTLRESQVVRREAFVTVNTLIRNRLCVWRGGDPRRRERDPSVFPTRSDTGP